MINVTHWDHKVAQNILACRDTWSQLSFARNSQFLPLNIQNCHNWWFLRTPTNSVFWVWIVNDKKTRMHCDQKTQNTTLRNVRREWWGGSRIDLTDVTEFSCVSRFAEATVFTSFCSHWRTRDIFARIYICRWQNRTRELPFCCCFSAEQANLIFYTILFWTCLLCLVFENKSKTRNSRNGFLTGFAE